jgi:TRAP transporter TatT component family protein
MWFNRHMRPILVLLCVSTAACSPATMGFNRMADAISATSSSYARDDDPEFVRAGAPATLKMTEMLLDSQPKHPGLLFTACSGFTQYAYAFLQVESEIAEPASKQAAADLKTRAAQMYERARRYCLRALDVRVPGIQGRLPKEQKSALTSLTRADIPLLYWTAAAWGGSIAVAENPMQRFPELFIVRALLDRALELDETWERGALHEAMIAVDGLPALVGGSPERARKHFDRAVELSGGLSAFAYLTLASSVSLPAKDRAEFERLLKTAVAIDVSRRPEIRLANLVAQKRARFLLTRAGDLFGR